MRRLRRGSLSAGEIAQSFDLTKPTLSHHFRVLREAGLVRAERQGTKIVYALQTNVLEDLAAELLELTTELTDGATRRAARRGT